MSRRKIRPTIPTIPSVVIVGDGHTEKIYFEQLNEEENIQGLTILPDLPKRSGWRSVIQKAFDKLELGADHAYCIIDKDKVIADDVEIEYELYKQEIHAQIQTLKLEGSLHIIECMPCIETWFLLHYEYTTAEMSTGEEAERRLKKYIPDYSKSQKYLNTKRIYNLLKPFQHIAISNSENLASAQQDDLSKCFPRCDVHQLIKALIRFNDASLERIYINGRKINLQHTTLKVSLSVGEEVTEDTIKAYPASLDCKVTIILESDLVSFECIAADKKTTKTYSVQIVHD